MRLSAPACKDAEIVGVGSSPHGCRIVVKATGKIEVFSDMIQLAVVVVYTKDILPTRPLISAERQYTSTQENHYKKYVKIARTEGIIEKFAHHKYRPSVYRSSSRRGTETKE